MKFFSEKDKPWNLALFRIIFFSFVFFQTKSLFPYFLFDSTLPSILLLPPKGCKILLSTVSVNPGLFKMVYNLFMCSCAMAIIGLFFRPAAFIAAICAIYVFGISQ